MCEGKVAIFKALLPGRILQCPRHISQDPTDTLKVGLNSVFKCNPFPVSGHWDTKGHDICLSFFFSRNTKPWDYKECCMKYNFLPIAWRIYSD